MRFGFHAINLGSLATPEAVRQIVAAWERYKIDSIWTGDHVIKRAMRRALELGDGWQPGWSRPDQLARELQDFQRVAERLGRDPKSVEISLLRPMQILTQTTDSHRPLVGTPEQIAEDIRVYQRLGVKHLVFSFRTRNVAEAVETVERFATQVRPLVS